MRYLLAILATSVVVIGSDALPTARLADWSAAGVHGGWVARTTIYTNRTSSFTAAQLQGWLDACPSNQVVQLPAGTYNLGNATVDFDSDGVTLRGQTNASGHPTTALQNFYMKMPSDPWPSANWAGVTTRSVSSGYSKGSTALTLGSAPGATFQVGRVVMMDQTDDGTLVVDGGNDWAHRPGRAYAELFMVTAINGNDLTITPAVAGTYWAAGRTVQVFSIGNTLEYSGIENLDIDQGSAGNTYTVTMGVAYSCWIRNCRFTGWGTSGGAAGVRPTYDVNCEIVNSVFHDQGAVSSSSYAIYPIMSEALLVQNNIFTNLALAMPMIGSVACSFSYNYGTGPLPYSPSNWQPEYFFTHGGHNHHNLIEGNFLVSPVWFDTIQGGNGSVNSVVRNRIVGYWSESQNNYPIVLEANMDDTTILGNVLGQNGFSGHAAYADFYNIDASCTGTIRTNNYNTFTDGVPASEAIGANTLQDSYAYTSKPAWFGDRTWPPFDPANAAAALTAKAYTNLPAGYRAEFGTDPPAAPTGLPRQGAASKLNAQTIRFQ